MMDRRHAAMTATHVSNVRQPRQRRHTRHYERREEGDGNQPINGNP